MSIVHTDLRVTRERAKQIRFYPAGAVTATNVQDAIGQAAAGGGPVPTVVTLAMSPYTPLASDTLLMVDTSAGSVTIAMLLAATRTLDLEIKDATGNAAANPISVTFSGGESADGLSPYTIDSNYASAKFGPKTGGYFVHA